MAQQGQPLPSLSRLRRTGERRRKTGAAARTMDTSFLQPREQDIR